MATIRAPSSSKETRKQSKPWPVVAGRLERNTLSVPLPKVTLPLKRPVTTTPWLVFSTMSAVARRGEEKVVGGETGVNASHTM